MHIIKTVACLAGLAVTASAFAGTATPPMDNLGGRPQMSSSQMYGMMMSRFEQSDKDHNGAISRAEAANMPMLEMHFDEVDANHDGQVTAAEMQAAFQQQMGKQARGPQNGQ